MFHPSWCGKTWGKSATTRSPRSDPAGFEAQQQQRQRQRKRGVRPSPPPRAALRCRHAHSPAISLGTSPRHRRRCSCTRAAWWGMNPIPSRVLVRIVCGIMVSAVFSVVNALLSPPSRGGFALRHHHVIPKLGIDSAVPPSLPSSCPPPPISPPSSISAAHRRHCARRRRPRRPWLLALPPQPRQPQPQLRPYRSRRHRRRLHRSCWT